MRLAADFDFDRARHIESRWPLVEVLLRCTEIIKARARVDFRHEELLWQIRATASRRPGKPPEKPAILRDEVDE